MIAQELVRRQRALDPKESLTAYAGEWVVLRAGHVIAHAQDLDQITNAGQLDAGDAILHVPEQPGDFSA